MSNRTHLAILPPIVAVVLAIVAISLLEKKPATNKANDPPQAPAAEEMLTEQSKRSTQTAPAPANRTWSIQDAEPGDIIQISAKGLIVEGKAPVATDYFAFVDMCERFAANDSTGWSQLYHDKKMLLVANGTTAKAIKISEHYTRVRLLSGEHKGQEVYAANVSLAKGMTIPEEPSAIIEPKPKPREYPPETPKKLAPTETYEQQKLRINKALYVKLASAREATAKKIGPKPGDGATLVERAKWQSAYDAAWATACKEVGESLASAEAILKQGDKEKWPTK